MKYIWLFALVLALAISGCTKDKTAPAPGHAPNDSSGTAGNPNPSATKNPANSGGAAGGVAAGGAAQTPPSGTNSGGAATKPAKPENLPLITRNQYDKISGQMTYDQVTKLLGNPGKLVADTGTKKTYQFQLKDDPKYYVNLVFNKGSFSEKSIFTL